MKNKNPLEYYENQKKKKKTFHWSLKYLDYLLIHITDN